MRSILTWSWLLIATSAAQAQLPKHAADEIAQFERDVAAIRKKADADAHARREALINKLQTMQVMATKEGNLDDALAIREVLIQLRKGGTPAPVAPPVNPPTVTPLTKSAQPLTKPVFGVGKDMLVAEVVNLAKPAPKNLPTSTSPNKSIVGKQLIMGGTKVSKLVLEAGQPVEDIVWTPKGDAFFTLSESGVLSRIDAAKLVEEKRLEIGQKCGFLTISAAGLLALLPTAQEVWVIDPTTLKVTSRIAAPGAVRILSGPTMSIAIAASKAEGHPLRDPQSVMILDLKKGEPVYKFSVPTRFARVSPDGKYYFAQGGLEQLMSYRIDGMNLVKDGQSGRIATNSQSVYVSPDSKFVAIVAGAGNGAKPYSTSVFPVGNLNQPAVVLASGSYPAVIGYDPAAKKFFAHNSQKQLIVFDAEGNKLHEMDFAETDNNGRPLQFVANPRGNKVLALTSQAMAYIEFE